MRSRRAPILCSVLLFTSACMPGPATDGGGGINGRTMRVVLDPASAAVEAGGFTTVNVLTGGTPGGDLWKLEVTGLPSGVTGTFNPTELHTGDTATLTLSATAQAAAGTSAFKVTAASLGQTAEATGQLQLVLPLNQGGGAGGGGGGPGMPDGGSVDLMHFGVTGDTRPPSCGDIANYPTPIITAIADAFQAKAAQFAVDLGDHMFVCTGSYPDALAQMNIYMGAVQHYSGPWYMTMGNHECTSGPCLPTSNSGNYRAFMEKLQPISSLPYYSFDVRTSLGLATFVVVADNAWSSAQQTWLQDTLTQADQKATYTIVMRHHPSTDTSITTNSTSMQIIRAHKFALFMTGHSHTYYHATTDNGRDIVLGVGGAPLATGATYNGYAMVDQLANGQLQVSVYNVSGDVLVARWSVGPNQ